MTHAMDRTMARARIGLRSALARLQNVKRYLKACGDTSAPAPHPEPLLLPRQNCSGRTHLVNDQQIVECEYCPR